ncbi:transcriptional regulator, AraC family [Geodermatophilus amargosae]|uniref:Transcriptional regulator, AraC family n=1 Tax=Geodermatophilus amargosae TaxID=1296565 RepID=A0A1I6YLL6_9ACTN|nr:helix-turn-helix domain-containing protein [Geodermatophilus amargosae]SFT51294.1 transcriptional regulator, AraC family [Geodermatophilus amargosae]
MEPDSAPVHRRDTIERAHLRDPRDASHVMYRYETTGPMAALVQRTWIPVWSVPPGEEAVQRVLQYPVCLVVVTPGYARFYGVVSGLSTTTLTGEGWAAGVMLTPAAGALVAGGPVSAYTDRSVDVAEVLGDDGDRLAARVRAAMAGDPHSPDAHAAARAAYDDALRRFLPVDGEGLLVDRLVALVESRPDLTRVDQLCAQTGLSERALQRLAARRLGLSPKWLVQRRRLQEAAERLRDRTATAAQVAADLGYADQPHLTRDFARVTGMTPGEFTARYAPGPAGPGTAGVSRPSSAAPARSRR